MKIHLISDIHLERGTHTIPSDLDFDVLVAAGDVCEGGVKGVEWLIDAAKGKPVIYVPGNHEYYCPRTAKKDRADILNEIRATAAGTNIHVLDGDTVTLQEGHGKSIRFIGATLWTNLGEKNESLMRVAGHGMRDYYMIQEQGRDLFHADVLDLHEKALEFFKQELAKPFDGQTICVSHHHPSLRSLKLVGVDEEHIDDKRSWSQRWSLSDGPPLGLIRRASYASDLTNLLSRFRHDISVWMCGHLHAKLDYVDAGVRVMCNPKGASGWETHGFDNHCISTQSAIRRTKNLLRQISRRRSQIS